MVADQQVHEPVLGVDEGEQAPVGGEAEQAAPPRIGVSGQYEGQPSQRPDRAIKARNIPVKKPEDGANGDRDDEKYREPEASRHRTDQNTAADEAPTAVTIT